MASWTVRAYRPGDEVGINDLFNVVFERGRPLSVRYWKFDRNPAAEEKVIAVAESENSEILSALALCRKPGRGVPHPAGVSRRPACGVFRGEASGGAGGGPGGVRPRGGDRG